MRTLHSDDREFLISEFGRILDCMKELAETSRSQFENAKAQSAALRRIAAALEKTAALAEARS